MASKRFIFYFKLSIAAVCMGGLALLCVPFATENGGSLQKVLVYLVAGTFWGSLILEQVFLKKCREERRGAEKQKSQKQKKNDSPQKRFFQTREAAIAAAVFLVAMLVSALLAVIQSQAVWTVILSVAVLYLSFNLYFVFNGKNFQYIKLNKGEK